MGLRILLCVSFEVEPGPCPKAELCFLAAPPLTLNPFPSGLATF